MQQILATAVAGPTSGQSRINGKRSSGKIFDQISFPDFTTAIMHFNYLQLEV